MTKVAILGCGPAGLLAAHAAYALGLEYRIFSLRRQSPIGGAQFLHMPIPGLTPEEPFYIRIRKVGDGRGYAQKMYGNADAHTSWEKMKRGKIPAWSLRSAYQKLWDTHSDAIEEVSIDRVKLRGLLDNYDLVLSSIPAPSLCVDPKEHQFKQVPLWLMPDAPGWLRGIKEEYVLYNGYPNEHWTRASCIGGETWTESPTAFPKGIGQLRGFKVVGHNCTCYSNHSTLVRIGRFGQWRPGVLTHHAYEEAQRAMLHVL